MLSHVQPGHSVYSLHLVSVLADVHNEAEKQNQSEGGGDSPQNLVCMASFLGSAAAVRESVCGLLVQLRLKSVPSASAFLEDLNFAPRFLFQ